MPQLLASRTIYPAAFMAAFLAVPHATQHEQALRAEQVCTGAAGFAGPCYSVRGRLRVYAEGPAIWVIGTKHYLKVEDVDQESGTCIAPENVRQFFTPSAGLPREAFGDFVVRARTAYRPGRLQRVCVASATHLVARNMPRTASSPPN